MSTVKYGTVNLTSPTIISSPTTSRLKRRLSNEDLASLPTDVYEKPKTRSWMSYVPHIMRVRLSKIPIVVVCCGLLFLVINYSEPITSLFLDDNDPYDAALYDFSKYPDKAGGHHGAPKKSLLAALIPSALSGGAEGDTPLEDAPATQDSPYGSGVLEYSPKEGLLRGFELISPMAGKDKGKRGKKKNRIEASTKGKRTRHPIEVMMEDAKQKWEGMLARQSRSLEDAVVEYVTRYKRLPPKGFDAWWKFCIENDVKIVDDFDQINHDIEPFYALSPAMFNERVNKLETQDFTYHINVGPDSPPVTTGARAEATRAKQLTHLVTSLGHLLPQQVTMHVSDHDLGSWILGDDQREIAMSRINSALMEDGTGLNKVKHFTANELKRLENKNRNGHKGWFSACPEDSPARGKDRELENRIREIDGLPPLPELARPAFLKEVIPSFDFCNNPQLQKLHGTMSYDFPRETILRPIFVLSKFSRNNEFLFPPLEAYENSTSAAGRKHHVDWSDKTQNKLFWRGTSTGDSYSKRKSDPAYSWRRAHRPRLHLMAQNGEGESEVWLKRGREWQPEMWSNQRLNEAYFDIGLTGKPHQCNQEDGTCDEMAAEIQFKERVKPEDAALYKYALDVDGNGWSSRFHRLLMSGSMVVKSTIFPEFLQEKLIPWYHYVPIQADYSDLYDVMAFFLGSPEGRTDGHDDLARKIADQGREFGEGHWNWESMQAYMLRLLLEYTRLQQEDRDAWSFVPEGMDLKAILAGSEEGVSVLEP